MNEDLSVSGCLTPFFSIIFQFLNVVYKYRRMAQVNEIRLDLISVRLLDETACAETPNAIDIIRNEYNLPSFHQM